MSSSVREDFAGRIQNPDPWFDGNNYRATIIVAPFWGTCLEEGKFADLADDGPTQIARRILEHSFFYDHHFEIVDYDITLGSNSRRFQTTLEESLIEQPVNGCLRYATIQLAADIDLFNSSLARQIGQTLWNVIEEPNVTTIPDDFLENHLIVDAHLLAVWNRRGIVIAFKNGDQTGKDYCQRIGSTCEKISQIILGLHLETKKFHKTDPQRTKELLEKFISIRLESSSPAGKVLRRYLKSTEFDRLLDAVHALRREEASERDARNGKLLNMIALSFAVPSLLLSYMSASSSIILNNWDAFFVRVNTEGILSVDLLEHWMPIAIVTIIGILIAFLGIIIVQKRQ